MALNLMGLCPECHEKHGKDPKYFPKLAAIVARREGLESWEVVRDAIARLLRRVGKEDGDYGEDAA